MATWSGIEIGHRRCIVGIADDDIEGIRDRATVAVIGSHRDSGGADIGVKRCAAEGARGGIETISQPDASEV